MIFFFSGLSSSSKSQKFNQTMKKLLKIHMKFLVWAFGESVFNKIAVAVANCDHQNSKLRRVAGAEGF